MLERGSKARGAASSLRAKRTGRAIVFELTEAFALQGGTADAGHHLAAEKSKRGEGPLASRGAKTLGREEPLASRGAKTDAREPLASWGAKSAYAEWA